LRFPDDQQPLALSVIAKTNPRFPTTQIHISSLLREKTSEAHIFKGHWVKLNNSPKHLHLKYNISEGKTELQAYEPIQFRRFCIRSLGIGTEWSDDVESFCTLEALNTSFSASGRNNA